jgi:hypothetical protein
MIKEVASYALNLPLLVLKPYMFFLTFDRLVYAFLSNEFRRCIAP